MATLKAINVKPIEVSTYTYDLIEAFNEWIEASSKVGYRFTEEEQHYLEYMVKVLNNQIDILVDYEIKRKEGE